jgi:teichoic acid transport system permease protein
MTSGMWIAAVAWAFGLLIVGTVFFWRAEERYGREI